MEVLLATSASFIAPCDSTRILFELAAFFGIPLLVEVPLTLLIVTGINSKIERSEWERTFKKYGEIEESVVTPGYDIGENKRLTRNLF